MEALVMLCLNKIGHPILSCNSINFMFHTPSPQDLVRFNVKALMPEHNANESFKLRFRIHPAQTLPQIKKMPQARPVFAHKRKDKLQNLRSGHAIVYPAFHFLSHSIRKLRIGTHAKASSDNLLYTKKLLRSVCL